MYGDSLNDSHNFFLSLNLFYNSIFKNQLWLSHLPLLNFSTHFCSQKHPESCIQSPSPLLYSTLLRMRFPCCQTQWFLLGLILISAQCWTQTTTFSTPRLWHHISLVLWFHWLLFASFLLAAPFLNIVGPFLFSTLCSLCH